MVPRIVHDLKKYISQTKGNVGSWAMLRIRFRKNILARVEC